MADVTLPTEDEFRALPRWARVAFAARCARRVQPLFGHCWPHGPTIHKKSIDQAIFTSESDAGSARQDAKTDKQAAAANNAANAASDDDVRGAVYAAAAATYAAIGDFRTVKYAVYAYIEVADDCIWPDNIVFQDFETLKKLASEQGWTDTTPVPPGVFGPMWPDGPPPGWPTDLPTSAQPTSESASADTSPDTDFQLIFRATLEDGAPPEEARRKLVGLYRSLNDYSLAKYGNGLAVEDFKRFVAAGVPAGVEP